MAASLRFLVVRRPGVYNTHSMVIQPMEHTLVNDGMPLLFKQFKASTKRWMKLYLPHIKIIEYDDISIEDADAYLKNPSKLTDDFDGASILINHPEQHKFTAFNLQQLYVSISNQSWHLTPSVLDYFGGTDRISTCLDHTNTANANGADWIKCDNQQLANSADITLRKTFQRYAQYLTYLRNDRLQKQLILFHSNHLSVPLSRQIKKVIRNWQPDTVLLESDAPRIERYVNVMKHRRQMGVFANYTSPTIWYHKFLDVGIAANASRKNIATHIVLSDWNIAQYRIMLRVARILDKLQSNDAIDRSTEITLHVFGQLFCPSLLPKINEELLNEYYQHTLKTNQPHYHWIYEKRNDIFANTLHCCHGNKLFGIFGHAHIAPIVQRLTGQESMQNPFQTMGSHNIRF